MTDDPIPCPDCQTGNHTWCPHQVLDDHRDEWVPCPCYAAGHGTPDTATDPWLTP